MSEHQLGHHIALLARASGLTQTEISEQCKISRVSLNRFFRGQSELRAVDLARVLLFLGIDLGAIVKSRLTQVTGDAEKESDGTLGRDMEFVLGTMSELGKRSYLGHLVAHAELKGDEIPKKVFLRLHNEMEQ